MAECVNRRARPRKLHKHRMCQMCGCCGPNTLPGCRGFVLGGVPSHGVSLSIILQIRFILSKSVFLPQNPAPKLCKNFSSVQPNSTFPPPKTSQNANKNVPFCNYKTEAPLFGAVA